MTSNAFTMTSETLTKTGNQQKELFLRTMVEEKIITQEAADKMNQYCFVIADKGFFGNLWNKLWEKKDDQTLIVVVKMIENIPK